MPVIHRQLMRCVTCRRWWSGEPPNGHVQTCACGGELAAVDMEAHLASLPAKVDTPEEVAQKQRQDEARLAAKAGKK